MNGAQRGFLLLTSTLGDPQRRRLSVAQFRILASRARLMERPGENRELTEADIMALGYGQENAHRIAFLLSQEDLLNHYLQQGRYCGCAPVTRVDEDYPAALLQKLGDEAPGCLWAKGDLSLLARPKVALVGSRDISFPNARFAREVGIQAAKQGFTLVSGNARGADRIAQEACLQVGGSVIVVVADELMNKNSGKNVLYLSEEDFDQPFSAQRAISRNRVIHALAQVTFVAQSSLRTGGTWDGTVKNLRFGWSPVQCYRDGSPSMAELCRMGAGETGIEQLKDIQALTDNAFFFL